MKTEHPRFATRQLRLLLLALMLPSLSAPTAAQIAVNPAPPLSAATSSPERLALARRVLERSGFGEQMRVSMDAMGPAIGMTFLGSFSQQPGGAEMLSVIERDFPGGTPAFSERFTAHFRERFLNYVPEMVDAAAGIYAERMTAEQLTATLAFLDSEAGSAWTRTTLDSRQLLSAIGGQYGMRAGSEAGDMMIADLEALMPASAGDELQ